MLEFVGHKVAHSTITVGALAGLVQRFVAIAKPDMEAEVVAFMQENGLETWIRIRSRFTWTFGAAFQADELTSNFDPPINTSAAFSV